MAYQSALRLTFFVVALGTLRAADTPNDSAFSSRVYPMLQKAECRICHNDNGVASGTRLRFPPEDAKPDAILGFGYKLSALVDKQAPEKSLLLNKPTMRIAHAGGERIGKGSTEEAALLQWIQYLASKSDSELQNAVRSPLNAEGNSFVPGTVRRLTHVQYNNTVRDLLGDFTRPADQFPQEDYLNGFTNQVEAQSIPPLLAEAYTVAAEKLAANAFRHGDTNKLIPCRSASAKDAVCRDKFIRQFGFRAFRRPLSDGEVKGYSSLFSEAGPELNFNQRAAVVVEAMLQSPSFLFHLETGPYLAASRLSYCLWDTMPDEQLFKAAEAGKLKDSAGVREIARKMIDDPRAKKALGNFLAQWMRFDRVLQSSRNVRRNQDFGPTLLAAMTEETKHLFNHLVWNDGNFMDFFAADYTFISARLAQLYGLPPPAQDFEMVKYPPNAKRAGVLGHAGFLTLTGNPNETSPTARGLFVREHFLCQNVPPPPPGVDTTLPPIDGEKPMTTRDRLAMHTSNKSCAGCHSLIDPIGSGLEGFDNIGRFREKMVLNVRLERDSVTNAERPPQKFELPLDTNGFIQGIPNSKFTHAAELGRILAGSEVCQKCMVRQIFRYAVGRHETEADRPYLEQLNVAFRNSQFRFRELLVTLVSSDTFMR